MGRFQPTVGHQTRIFYTERNLCWGLQENITFKGYVYFICQYRGDKLSWGGGMMLTCPCIKTTQTQTVMINSCCHIPKDSLQKCGLPYLTGHDHVSVASLKSLLYCRSDNCLVWLSFFFISLESFLDEFGFLLLYLNSGQSWVWNQGCSLQWILEHCSVSLAFIYFSFTCKLFSWVWIPFGVTHHWVVCSHECS